MSSSPQHATDGLTEQLALAGYWPAQASRLVDEGRFAEAVALCRERLVTDPHTLAGRTIYAVALYRAGQNESASEQFFILLSRDPDNLVALKYLGDMKFAEGDELTATTYYERIQHLDPHCAGLACPLERPTEQTKTITLSRAGEAREADIQSRKIPFYTETVGDLYLDQGHARLAAEVYRMLYHENASPRLAEKINRVEQLISRKER